MSAILDVPPDLLGVQQTIADAMARVEQRFNDALRTDLPPVEALCRHIESYRGKMLRPALVALCGLAADPGSTVSEDHITVGAVCEMIHMATLVHDDVLDEADVRRKGATVNRLHGNEAAVILGDYLFSAAYRLCSSIPGPLGQRTALLIGQTGMTLCAGELLQLHHREDYSLDEATYFEIVERKTASLIAASCRLGALHAGAPDDLAERFAEFGMRLGVAFQIQDDLLDLTGSEAVVGKPLRRDVELGKLTLPLIHHLAAAGQRQRGRTLALIGADGPDAAGAAAVGGRGAKSLLQAVLSETGSIEHARESAIALVARARAALDPVPDSPAKRVLLLMAEAVVDRAF
jgi:octaprenyl-diphosphate synthase